MVQHWRSLLGAVTLLFASTHTLAGPDKALVVGIDGCRPDALLAAKTPVIETLWRQGAFCFHARNDVLTVSGPCWSSVLTGVWSARHGVLNNKFERGSVKYPTFFERIKAAKPESVTAVFTAWPALVKLVPPAALDLAMSGDENDTRTTAAAADALRTRAVDVVMVHLDGADEAGHKFGFGPDIPEYMNAIQAADKDVGELLAAIRSRPGYANENWLVVLTTDHGGLGKKHGGKSAQESTVFLIFSGKSVKRGEILEPPSLADILPTLLTHLGINVLPAWELDGRIIPLSASPH